MEKLPGQTARAAATLTTITIIIELNTKPDLFLPEFGLHLDSRKGRKFGFISHGHADHFGRHERIICSKESAIILKARYSVGKSTVSAYDYGVPVSERGFTFELLPAGHITGSAMIHITRESDGATLLYTGDCKTRESLTAKTIECKPADILITETTFGRPQYDFPSHEEVSEQLVTFVDDCQAEGITPVLVAYSLGKAQEAHAILNQAGIRPVLHRATAKMALACIKAGVDLGHYNELDELVPERHCLIVPPQFLKNSAMASIGRKRTAMLTGWAQDPDIQYKRRGIDHFIPLSDHADYAGLLDIVNRVSPKKIITVHGFTKEFASDLRRLGHEAWCSEGDDQLDLL